MMLLQDTNSPGKYNILIPGGEAKHPPNVPDCSLCYIRPYPTYPEHTMKILSSVFSNVANRMLLPPVGDSILRHRLNEDTGTTW